MISVWYSFLDITMRMWRIHHDETIQTRRIVAYPDVPETSAYLLQQRGWSELRSE